MKSLNGPTFHLFAVRESFKACFKRRILHASNSIVSIMYMLSATSETIKFDVSNCGRRKGRFPFSAI